jgi:hypothetical protein
MKPRIIAMPPEYDHDIVRWEDGDKSSGEGFIARTIYDGRPAGWINLERCPECGGENYALAVTGGICCWCGFNANEESDHDTH